MSSALTRKKCARSKNTTKEDWLQLGIMVDYRKRDCSKESDIYMWGKKVDAAKAKKEMNRPRGITGYDLAVFKQSWGRQPPLGCSVRTPIPRDWVRPLIVGLPFDEFELDIGVLRLLPSQFPLELPASPTFEMGELRTPTSTVPDADSRGIQSSETGSSGLLRLVPAALESIMPPTENQESWLSDSFLVHHVSPLYRRILFSVSNNFAGLGTCSLQEVLKFLRNETSGELYKLIETSDSYSAKAIARNLFRGAIEAGDAVVVQSLLKSSTANIDPDLEICYVSGKRYTPIERASALRYKAVIEVLLQHPIDLNRSYDINGSRGALSHAIFDDEYAGMSRKYESGDPDIFKMLLDAGGDVDYDTLAMVIDNYDDKLAIQIIKARAQQNHEKWSEGGWFRLAFEKLHVDTCKDIIELMVDAGAAIDYDDIIDVAARCGNVSMIETLIKWGAIPTDDTLACAVSSGALDLVDFLLESPWCAIDDIGTLGTTPLAAAIRLGDSQMRESIEKRGGLKSLSRKSHFSSALKAASAVGDVQYLTKLVHLRGDNTPDDLGIALEALAKNGHHYAALLLLDAGASLTDCGGYLLLSHALKRHDQDLVTMLLNAGANPNRRPDDYKTPILLAVGWKNHGVVRRLIFEGARPKDTISVAVKNRDFEMLEILIKAGADVNDGLGGFNERTALAVATKLGDIKMVELLLAYGAHPNNSKALENATSPELQDVLIARYCKMYPHGRKGFGGLWLQKAVIQGDESRLATLLDNGMDPTSFGREEGQDTTPFGYAISKAQPNRNGIIEILLSKGCDPNGIVSRVSFGIDGVSQVTALLAAVSTDDQSVVELLLRSGANLHYPAKGSVKRTPLQRAAQLGLHEMVEYLILLDADVNAPAAHQHGGTALQLAALGGHMKTIAVLLSHKASVDAPGSKVNGKTALEGAAENGRLDTVQMLLNARETQSLGIDRPQFERAQAYARENRHLEVAEMIEDYQHRNIQGGRVEEG